ncbi:hypothetical protein DOLIC_00079 [Dolichomitus sp. PSUC_FEM 10030005]|nr:hypothetical protein [Dolichomitus sp. PSUC_FEM 10030005]
MDKNTYIIIGLGMLIIIPFVVYLLKRRSVFNEIKLARLESARSPESPYMTTTTINRLDSDEISSSDCSEWHPEAPDNSTLDDMRIESMVPTTTEVTIENDQDSRKSQYLITHMANFLLEPKKKYSVTMLPRSLNCAKNINEIKFFARKKSKLRNIIIHGYSEMLDNLQYLTLAQLEAHRLFSIAINVPMEDKQGITTIEEISDDEGNYTAVHRLPMIMGNVKINDKLVPGENRNSPLSISRFSIRRLGDHNYSIKYPKPFNVQQTVGDSSSIASPISNSGAPLSLRPGILSSIYIEPVNTVGLGDSNNLGSMGSGELRIDVY